MIVQRRSGWLMAAIALLALASAVIHFQLMLPKIDPIFTLNALGYIGLTAAYCFKLPVLEKFPKLVRFAFIGYTLLTILLWVFMGQRDVTGYITKGIEILLVLCLVFDRP